MKRVSNDQFFQAVRNTGMQVHLRFDAIRNYVDRAGNAHITGQVRWYVLNGTPMGCIVTDYTQADDLGQDKQTFYLC